MIPEKNHISVIVRYLKRLIEITRHLKKIERARVLVSSNPKVHGYLDHLERNLIIEKIKLQDEMFEIQRSN